MKKPAKTEELALNIEVQKQAGVATRLQGHVDKITSLSLTAADNLLAIGGELLAIREEADFSGTFESFVKVTFGKTRDWAYKMIESYETKKALPASVEHEIQNPRQALALAAAPFEKRAAVVQGVKDSGKKMTAKMITKEIEKQRAIDADVEELDDLGTKIPKDIFPEWDRARNEAKWARGQVNGVAKWFKDGLGEEEGAKRDPIFRAVTMSNQKLFADIKRQIAMVDPYAVCPTCKGTTKKDGKKCNHCKGTGFISKFEYENAQKKKEPKAKKTTAKK
jgi:hypothetical protein